MSMMNPAVVVWRVVLIRTGGLWLSSHQVIEAKWVCPICMATARKWNKQHLARRCCHKHLIHMHHLRPDDICFELVKRRVGYEEEQECCVI